MAEDDNDNEGAAAQEQAPQFNIQRTYLKDVSFETPMGVAAFTQQGMQPQVSLDVNTSARQVGENVHEVTLTIEATARHEEQTVYLIEVKQAGVFSAAGFPEDRLRMILGTVCPNFLFPYARETIDSLAMKGSFAPLNLSPIDFEAIYRRAESQREEATAGDGSATLN